MNHVIHVPSLGTTLVNSLSKIYRRTTVLMIGCNIHNSPSIMTISDLSTIDYHLLNSHETRGGSKILVRGGAEAMVSAVARSHVGVWGYVSSGVQGLCL